MTKTSQQEPNWEERFHRIGHLTKKEVLKAKPGTWLQIKWLDDADTMCLLLRKPDRDERGEVSLYVMCPDGVIDSRPTHTQVVAIHGNALDSKPELKVID